MGQTLAQGHDFAGYRIERLLGVGGMGEVYLAHDRDLPRFVALKLLSRAMTNDDGVRARFQREADTAARLSHPNIVAVYARGQQDDQLWIAMEYIDGTDVAAVLREGPLHPAHAVRIISEAARALDHAHRTGFLHRDVKPANILLARGPQERVLLADFGIAKALDESAALTRTGELFASLQYAAPEQFNSELEIDRRADVYALGCTLYHLLIGVIPYPGMNSAQLINAHLNLPAPLPTRQNPALPIGFDAVIARAMAKDPGHRFDSCGELAAAAAAALAGAHVPQPMIPAPRKERGRAPLIIAIAIGLVLALGGAGVAVAFALRSSSSQQQQAAVEDSRTAAQEAGCAYMRTMMTYDYNNLDAYKKSVDNGATGSFKQQFNDTWTTLRDLMAESKVSSQIGDVQCFYKSGDANHAEVAVIATQQVTNNVNPTPQSTQISMIMTLDRIDGRWLCSKLDSTQPPK